jgi:hypothetical protein
MLKEQCVCIKFCQKLGKMATGTDAMLQKAFGETALSRSKTFEWYSRFKNGCMSIDDDPRTGRPSVALSLTRKICCITSFFPSTRLNQTVYITVLQCLRDAVRWKRPHKWSSGTRLLHHDNAPCHTALSVGILGQAQHPHGSPPALLSRFTSCYFFLFLRLKSTLKGKQFQDVA